MKSAAEGEALARSNHAKRGGRKVAKKASAGKQVVQKQKKQSAKKDDGSDVEMVAVKKPTAAAAAARKTAPAKPVAKEDLLDSEDDEMDLGLAARLKEKLRVSPAGKPGKRKDSSLNSLEVDSDSDPPPKKAKKAAKKKGKVKKQMDWLDDDSEDDFNQSEAEELVSAKPMQRGARTGRARKPVVYSK